jgi:hypothetical protein
MSGGLHVFTCGNHTAREDTLKNRVFGGIETGERADGADVLVE